MINKIVKTIQAGSLSLLVFFSGQAQVNAGVLSLSQTPLFLGTSIQPNVFFMMDDSGSMDWEFLVGAYWDYYAYDPDPRRNGSFSSSHTTSRRTDGYMRSYRDDNLSGSYGLQLYMYVNTGNLYGSTGCANNYYNYSRENCTGTSVYTADWRLRSNGFNRIWYTPNIEYKPWAGPCLDNGTDCADADFFNVRSNPREGENGYTQLRDLSVDGSGDNNAYVYDVWIDDAGFSGSHPDRGNNQDYTPGANNEVDLWDSHLRFVVEANMVHVSRITYAPDNAGLNEQSTPVVDLTNTTTCYDLLGPINTNAIPSAGATNGPGCRTIGEAQTNIANWYQYNRKRVYAAKSAISTVISAQPNFRYGISVFKDSGVLFEEVPGSTVTNTSLHNLQLKNALYQHDQRGLGTPLREGLNLAGRYFDNSLGRTDPILFSCQKNFTILLTDGYYNGDFNLSNQDGDQYDSTVADIAYRYYFNDLSGLADNVKVDAGEEDIDPDGNKLTHQHMVTFTVAFGVEGEYLSDGDDDGWPDLNASGNSWGSSDGLPTKNGDWGEPKRYEPSTIDDIWHAAFNSNGIYASASSAAAVAEKLIDAISNIAGRIGSASAVALNSGTLNANSRVYQAKFDSNDWSGALTSIPIKSAQPVVAPATTTCTSEAIGELCPQEWDAAEKLESMSYSARNVFSWNMDTNSAVQFKTLANLGVAQQAALSTHPDTGVVSASSGQDRLDYVLGDNSNEGSGSADFRVRKTTTRGTSKLGDLIHSSPAFSGAPNAFYPNLLEGAGNSYSAFRLANQSRDPVVFVGANDGMLHAFNAADGTEEFAYIPGRLVEKLNQLSSQNYNNSHTYFVDGSPKVFDAFDGSAWKTMLASSVGAGGQVVFALDITDPTSFSASDVKWEFTDRDDPDLGYTVGDVSFARMNNGKWAVIFGNGYNNTVADGNASGTGNAVIYVVDAFTGALIAKFDTETGTADDPLNPGSDRPNGMARVTPVDIDGDFNVDYLYGGDLFGNVWKIDVSATSSSSWDFAYKNGTAPKPFFVARDGSGDVQAITAGIAVKRHPEQKDQTIVLFGTGKYMEVGDSAIPSGGGQIQSFYGVWDDGTGNQSPRTALLQQEILSETLVTGADGIDREFRVTSSEEQPAYKIDWSTHKGWFIDLRYGTTYGERVVVEPVVRNNRVIFVTLIPDEDPCSSGGDGWIMELNADSGSRLPTSPFDVNGDGLIDSDDFVNYSNEDTIISGVKSRSGIVAKQGILNNPSGGSNDPDEYKYFSGTSGKVDVVSESADKNKRKRQSWRQQR